MSKFIDWFDRFLDEKSIPYASWEIPDQAGTTHFIDSDVVVEHIKVAPDHEQSKIKDILVKIDFRNGDVNHFFKHLATGLVSQYGGFAG
jgi:hypothetical protein